MFLCVSFLMVHCWCVSLWFVERQLCTQSWFVPDGFALFWLEGKKLKPLCIQVALCVVCSHAQFARVCVITSASHLSVLCYSHPISSCVCFGCSRSNSSCVCMCICLSVCAQFSRRFDTIRSLGRQKDITALGITSSTLHQRVREAKNN